MRPCVLLLVLGVYPVLGAPPCQTSHSESAPKQNELLSAARDYASRYMATLPSFICTQTVDQFESGKKAKHWRKGDRLTSQLVWDQGREQRTLLLVNDRPLSKHPIWHSPLVSEGEFGNLLDSVLGRSSQAVFSWRGWDTIRNNHVAVFDYQVALQHSSLRLSLGSVQAVLAFHGTIYVDDNSGTVWRVTNEANQFPPELQTKAIFRSVDYGEVPISSRQYVLPIHATVLLDTGRRNIRNELWFDGYQKFDANSRISFNSEGVSTTDGGNVVKR